MKKFITAGITVLLLLAGCSTSGNSAEGPKASDSSSKEGQSPVKDEWYSETYGTFDAVTKNGKGDAVMKLPKGVTSALVTASHKGRSNFAIQVLDAENQPTLDLLVNTIGRYSGTTALGLSAGMGSDPAKLKISADGSWTLKLASVSTAPNLKSAGSGDAVFLYDEDAATAAVAHKGKSNFVVTQYSDNPMPNLAINEIGNYKGTVPLDDGPSVITIKADGKWTIKAE